MTPADRHKSIYGVPYKILNKCLKRVWEDGSETIRRVLALSNVWSLNPSVLSSELDIDQASTDLGGG
jgi:hypothetical protein